MRLSQMQGGIPEDMTAPGLIGAARSFKRKPIALDVLHPRGYAGLQEDGARATARLLQLWEAALHFGSDVLAGHWLVGQGAGGMVGRLVDYGLQFLRFGALCEYLIGSNGQADGNGTLLGAWTCGHGAWLLATHVVIGDGRCLGALRHDAHVGCKKGIRPHRRFDFGRCG